MLALEKHRKVYFNIQAVLMALVSVGVFSSSLSWFEWFFGIMALFVCLYWFRQTKLKVVFQLLFATTMIPMVFFDDTLETVLEAAEVISTSDDFLLVVTLFLGVLVIVGWGFFIYSFVRGIPAIGET